MSSILTNSGAMTALRTLKAINRQLSDTREMISTGKRINSAKHNPAVWAIAKTMESDVAGFARISDSLNLGQSTVAVARKGAETVTDLLTQMKEKIIAAQEENVDRAKIQTDIEALKQQLRSTVGASQFNGLNLLNNRERPAGSGDISILASLDRSSNGRVRASDIDVWKQDLSMEISQIGGGLSAEAVATNDIAGNGDGATFAIGGAATPNTATTTFGTSSGDRLAAGDAFAIQISGTSGDAPANTTAAREIRYVARDGDTMADVTRGLALSFNQYVVGNMGQTAAGSVQASFSGNELTITGATGAGNDFSIQIDKFAADATTTIGGGLEYVDSIDVTTQKGGDAALAAIDGLLSTSIDAAAAFGSAEMRLETQHDFISSLSSSLKSGIGTLVDANMEEAAAQLQALQVQQQLSVISLSIANQAPQYLLRLFQ